MGGATSRSYRSLTGCAQDPLNMAVFIGGCIGSYLGTDYIYNRKRRNWNYRWRYGGWRLYNDCRCSYCNLCRSFGFVCAVAVLCIEPRCRGKKMVNEINGYEAGDDAHEEEGKAKETASQR
eukprot:786247_1